MRKSAAVYCSTLLVAILTSVSFGADKPAAAPKNVALGARAWASSIFSREYHPVKAINGMVSGSDWAVKGTPDGWIEIRWDKPVEASQAVYWARTTSPLLECFKDYEVYLNDAKAPATKGTLQRRRGPQLINFKKQTVKKLRIKFLSSHPNSPNPGAAEIAVYSEQISKAQLTELMKPANERTPAAKAMRKELLDGKLGFKKILLVKRKPLNISHVYVYHVEGFRPGGGLYVYSADTGETKCIYDAGEGMITTADLSYDAKEVVFALRRGGHVASNPVGHIADISFYPDEKSNYQIFKIGIDGKGLKQLTTGKFNNLDPCWLPDGGIGFISDRKPAYAYCYVVTSPVLYRMESDGSKQIRLSANYLMDFTPSVLNDGRIIYTRWEYVDRPACPIQSLWAIKPDGTGLSVYYGNRVISPGTFMDAQPIPGTNQVIATATNHNGSCRGGIIAIDPSKGVNSKKAIRNLTPEIDIYAHRIGGGPWGNGMLDMRVRGQYEKPFAISDKRFLVSKGGTIQLRDFDANVVSLISPEGGMGWYCPMPVVKVKRPPLLFGTIAKLPEDGSVSGAWATIYMQDVYNGLEPHVKRGQIKQIAVIQEIEKSTHSPQNNKRLDGHGMRNIAVFGFQFPLVSCGATYAPKKVWGFADVQKDGSAAFQVPSEVPIYFLALDAEGRALQRMRSFTHLMPGEVQGCVGCHADRNSVASSGPKVMASAARTKPQKLQVPAWGVKGFSYQEVVQGVFDRNCIKCHNEKDQPGNVDLTGDMTDFFNVSYDILARTGTQSERNWGRHGSPSGAKYDKVRGMSPYTEWIWTINGAGANVLEIKPMRWGSPASKLADIIRTGHPDKKGKKRVNVPLADQKRVYLWIDLNVPYYGTSSSNHKARLGSRRMMPQQLEPVLKDVVTRRCLSCHKKGVPRKFYTRVMKPQNNNFLLAPLAKSAGGTQKCGKPIFESTDDADYQKIIKTFEPIHKLLRARPRADMKNFKLLCD
ncbi:MAG: hypothetical protein HN350_12760 [Phycisphaerales bacterium]|jgi:hypothetical protein|nr:hypothetical protein [Phycisphaerales bacterium]